MATSSTSTATSATPVKVETVTLRQLAETLSESHELPKKQVMSMLEEMVTTVTKHLKRGARIRIAGSASCRCASARRAWVATGDRRGDQDQGEQEGRLPRAKDLKERFSPSPSHSAPDQISSNPVMRSSQVTGLRAPADPFDKSGLRRCWSAHTRGLKCAYFSASAPPAA